jgi:oligoendopeptidase F
MRLPPRSDVDPEYRFDLTRIFETPDDYERARETLLEALDDLAARADEPLAGAEDLRALLAATEECHRRKQRLRCYATLSKNVATRDDDAAARKRRLGDVDEAFGPAVAAVHRRLRETDPDRLDALLAALDDYAFYGRNLREQAAHSRRHDVEEAIAALESAAAGPSRVVAAATGEDLRTAPVERPDGEAVEITYGNRGTELSNPDRDYRRRVYEAYHDAMERHEHAIATAYVEKLDAAAAVADLRGYDSIRDRDLRGCYPDSGLDLALPGSVHDTMLSAIQSNLGPYHRALRVRRERLGVDTLRPWDTGVPITDADPEVTYDEAREMVVEAVAPLGEAYAARVERFLGQRRVDVYPTKDKRTDIPAYCPSTATDGAFVLANFRDDVRSTFGLAHELGHAMNVAYHREGPARYATNSQAISEVPSILHELLLAEHLLEHGGAFAAAARNRLLDCLGGNLYGAGLGAAFAHRTTAAVEDGDGVTAERLRDTYADLVTTFTAPVAYPDDPGRHWFAHARRGIYDSYQYVLGATGALVVRHRLLEGRLSPGDYLAFLGDTGREGPLVLFERLGCEVTSEAAYERAAAAFDGYVDDVAT